MTNDGVREELRRIGKTHPVGVTLGPLAEVVKDKAEDHSRIVLGTPSSVVMGVDAIRYRPWEGA